MCYTESTVMPRFLKKTYFIQDAIETLQSEINNFKHQNPILKRYPSLKKLKENYEEHQNKALAASKKKKHCEKAYNDFQNDLSKKPYEGRDQEIADLKFKFDNASRHYESLLKHELFRPEAELVKEYKDRASKVTCKQDRIDHIKRLYSLVPTNKELDYKDVELIDSIVDAYFSKNSIKSFLASINMKNGKLTKKKVDFHTGSSLIERAAKFAEGFLTLNCERAKKDAFYMQEYFLLDKLFCENSCDVTLDYLRGMIESVILKDDVPSYPEVQLALKSRKPSSSIFSVVKRVVETA